MTIFAPDRSLYVSFLPRPRSVPRHYIEPAIAMALSSAPPKGGIPSQQRPNATLYCSNLPDKLQKEDLRRALYMLFSTYGPVLDIVALKTSKMRGQAHVLFRDAQASTQAMRALQGHEFFGKDMVSVFHSSNRDAAADWLIHRSYNTQGASRTLWPSSTAHTSNPKPRQNPRRRLPCSNRYLQARLVVRRYNPERLALSQPEARPRLWLLHHP